MVNQEPTGFAGIYNMQDMTSGICDIMAVGYTGSLRDTRDNKVYWVAKLKDNQCWMTQNLDLDLSTSKPLTSADSDVGNWTPTNNTQTTANPSFTGSSGTPNLVQSWDPAQGEAATYCPSGKCSTTSTTSSNNGHDAQGNYYTWGAATAGQAAKFTSSTTYPVDSTQSICPKGWTLPTSNSTTADKSFGYLLNGLTVAQITAAPYYFVYGGYVNSSSLRGAGSDGCYWSSTAYSSTYAYVLSFNTSVNPSGYSNRYVGFSVRCVAR